MSDRDSVWFWAEIKRLSDPREGREVFLERGLEAMGAEVPSQLSDGELILVIEELALHRNRAAFQRARAKLLAEQALRSNRKHKQLVHIALWTLGAALAGAAFALVALFIN